VPPSLPSPCWALTSVPAKRSLDKYRPSGRQSRGERPKGFSWDILELGAPLALAAERCTELGGEVALGRVGERGTGRLSVSTAGASGTLP
jgi:hypothetical protein